MNPREFELLNLLSAHEATGRSAAKPVKLAKTLAGDPAAPAMTDLMAVAGQTADADVVEKVIAYCRAHPEYGEMLDQFTRFAKDEEIPEPQIEGSILERMNASNATKSARAAPRRPGTERAEGWSHALAASTGGVTREPTATGMSEQTRGATGWWVLRPTADGGELYVGDPARIRSNTGWEAVVVDLPAGPRKGSLAYASPELVVVLLERPEATSREDTR